MAINSLDELKNDFLIYASEVNTNRSFADARDGLKPSQRACLYTMYTHGYTSNKPHVKCAKVDGATIAELIPHGSEYSTFVRMSQPWVNNICEVDFHGGNGSLLGGPDAAASRYTECRLSKASEEGLLEGLKKKVVNFIPNFSEDLEWPEVLPAIMPRLFVNGSQGIGYTIAQEWEPGNLNEFVEQVKSFTKNGKVDCSNIYPDYPAGGVIINKDDIHTIYETGKGSVVVRAKTEVNDNLITITELPYQVYAEPVIQKIKDLVNSGDLVGIEDICNKSDDNGLLIEIECSESPEVVLNKLFKLTDLQCTFSANMMALVDRVPTLLTLKDYIKVYVDHNISCLRKEYEYDLDKANTRIEVVNGLLKAIPMLDTIISTIRKSNSVEDAKNAIVKLGFTDNQARAIVDMRLSKLAHTEIADLEKESNELTATIKFCTDMLDGEKNLTKELLKRLDEFTKKYGWERRTQVTQVDIVKEKAVAKVIKQSNDQYMVVLTDDNHIKRIPLANYKPSKNVINAIKVGVRDKVIMITSDGMMYKLVTSKIGKSTMQALGDDLSSYGKVLNIYSGNEPEEFLFFLTKKGLGKKMVATDVYSIGKNSGATIMKLEDDEIIRIKTSNFKVKVGGKNVSVDLGKFRAKGRGAGGVKAIKLKDGQCIL